jgi:NADH dehydrogenase/NADH:ubiquinone oxidoreductase subunit G
MMSEQVSFRINGSIVKAAQGTSVLEAALDYGICIPHLCHLKGVSPVGVCRLCIVEVASGGRSKITTSCTLEAEEGLEIQAHTPKVMKIRKGIAELLVAEAPNSRAIQDVAVRCGVTSVRYPFRGESCVLCGKCVRVCKEVWQAQALGEVGRGETLKVGLAFGKRPDSCKRCNACIYVCPMTITPCPGPMKKGEEYLCASCASQLTMMSDAPGSCVRCRLGRGYECIRQVPVNY